MFFAPEHWIWRLAGLSLLVAGCLAAPSGHASPPGGKFNLVFTGQALGELKPCGCAKEEDQGGIERRMGFFQQVLSREIPALRMDLGDNFKEPTRQGIAKAETMARAAAQMQYDALVPGEKDLIYGVDFLKKLPPLPWTAANLKIEGLNIAPYRINKRLQVPVALIGLVDPDLFYSGSGSGVSVTDPEQALQQVLKTLDSLTGSEKPGLVVLLTHMPRKKALSFLDHPRIDAVLNGHIQDDQHLVDFNPVHKDGKVFVQPAPRGQKIGILEGTFQNDGGIHLAHRVVKLDSKIPSDKGMTDLYAEYDERVEALFMESLAAKRKKKTSVYATEQTCLACHAEAHATWSASRHGHAYATLERVNKAFDPECLVCHTTGFNQPGGFISEVDTPELKNVQCEVCHGPRREHAQNPAGGFAGEARKACARCHVRNHSPHFHFDLYWPKIAH